MYNADMLATLRFSLVFVAIAMLFLVPVAALYAQGNVGNSPAPSQIVPTSCSGADCDLCDLVQLAQNILNFAIYLSVFVAALLFAYAGIRYVSAGGNPSTISQAHSIFANVFIGLLIILAAWLVVDTLMKTLTGGTFGPWNQVCGGNSLNFTN